MTLRALPCPAEEWTGVQAARLAASVVAVLGSAPIVGVALLNLMGMHHDSHPVASLVFALTSLLLAISCAAGLCQPRRGIIFSLAAATALALGCTDLGRGVSRLSFTLAGVAQNATIVSLLAMLLGVVFLCTQIAASLMRKQSCRCS